MTKASKPGSDTVVEEWRVPPEFPGYEVTVTGGIRKSGSKEPVPTYMGRVTFDGPLHPRVRLVRRGVKYPVAMRDLIKSAFKTIPRTVVPQPKPKRTVVAPKLITEVPLKNANDALSKKEWRVIPEFPDYAITKDGDVRNRTSGKLLKRMVNTRNAQHYTLWKTKSDHTRGTASRSPNTLVWDAFPELKPDLKGRQSTPANYTKRPYILGGEWRDIPNYPKVEAHDTGAVRYKTSGKRVPTTVNAEGIEFVNLRGGPNGETQWLMSNLMALVFPEKGHIFTPEVSDDPNWRVIPNHETYEFNYEGEVRHRVRKKILVLNRFGFVQLQTNRHRVFWRKDRFGTPEEWEAFWNEPNKLEKEAA